MVDNRQWAAPGLEQVLEMLQGILPREFKSWDEVRGSSRDLFPTPNAEVNGGTRSKEGIAKRIAAGDKQFSLEDAITLLPTPVAQEVGTSPERYDQWCVEMKDKHGNGNGHGASLSVEAQRYARGELLPTPVNSDAKGSRNSTCWRGNADTTNINVGDTITDALWKIAAERGDIDLPDGPARNQLLPTPSTHDKTGARSPETIAAMDKPFSNLNDTVVNDLLQTPQARDGKGIPGPGFNKGNLHSQIADLFHTPAARDGNGLPPHQLLCTPTAGAGGQTSRGGDLIGEKLLGGQAREMQNNWGKYAPAIIRWEALTRPAPAPTEPNNNGKPRLAAPFSEWMMGWPDGHCTSPDIGLRRTDQLRIIGNGVCPQQAYAALRYLASIIDAA